MTDESVTPEQRQIVRRVKDLPWLSGAVAVALNEQGYTPADAVSFAEVLSDKYPDWDERPNTVLVFCHLERQLSDIEAMILGPEKYGRLFPPLPAPFDRKPGDQIRWALMHPRHLGRLAIVIVEPLKELVAEQVRKGLEQLQAGSQEQEGSPL